VHRQRRYERSIDTAGAEASCAIARPTPLAVATRPVLLMATTRHLLQAIASCAPADAGAMGVDTPTISGKRLAFSGLDHRQQDRRTAPARGFDMEIRYHNRKAVTDSSYRYFASLPIELATWPISDLRRARRRGTRHLVNADVLTALGPQGYLVNVGAGRSWSTQP